MPKYTPYLFLGFAVFFLLGQGCVKPQQTAPATPPPAQQDSADDAMMDDLKDDAMMDATGEPLMKDDAMMEDDKVDGDDAMDDSAMERADTGSATYTSYTKRGYEQALTNGQPTVLFFYANWCPTCTREEPILKAAVQETTFGLNAIRVNYKDTDTDSDEEALAKQYGIFTQHTFVYLDANGNEVARTIGTQGASKLRTQLDALR